MIVLCIHILLCFLLVSSSLDQSLFQSQAYRDIVDALQNEYYEDAMTLLLHITGEKNLAEYSHLVQLKGAVALKLGRFETARHYMELCASLGGLTSAPLYANYILALRHSENLDKAVAISWEALEKFPKDMSLHQTVGSLFAHVGLSETSVIIEKMCLMDVKEELEYSCAATKLWSHSKTTQIRSIISHFESKIMLREYHQTVLHEFTRQYLTQEEEDLHYSERIQAVVRDVLLEHGAGVALDFVTSLKSWLGGDFNFMFDVGVLAFFNGQYSMALDHCQAASMIQKNCYLIQTCIGASAIYLSLENVAIAALKMALSLHSQGIDPTPNLIFSISPAGMAFNLLGGMYTFKRYNSCTKFALQALNLPPANEGGAVILALSMIDWSKSNTYDFIEPLEKELITHHKINIPTNTSLSSIIQRLHEEENSLLLPTASFCIQSLDKELWQEVSGVVLQLMKLIEQKNSIITAFPSMKYTYGGIVLLTQYYSKKDGTNGTSTVKDDIKAALWRNLNNNLFEKVILFCDQDYDISEEYNQFLDKISLINLGRRMTFYDAFHFANENLSAKTVVLGIFADLIIFPFLMCTIKLF